MSMKKISFSFILFFSLLSILVFASGAHATGGGGIIGSATGSGGDMQQVLCNVLKFVTGGVGKTLASFIIIGVGLGFFTGKVSWGLLIGVTLGIAAMFGAPAIIAAITGGGTQFCSGYSA